MTEEDIAHLNKIALSLDQTKQPIAWYKRITVGSLVAIINMLVALVVPGNHLFSALCGWFCVMILFLREK
jgi:hypothetical protein